MNDFNQQTICGYSVEHLVLIATLLQKENLPPECVSEALTDIARIVAIVRAEYEEQLKQSIERCMIDFQKEVINNGKISEREHLII